MSRRVRSMFSSIAGDYDRTNRILSFGVDGRWRRLALKAAGVRAGDRVLDVACGTGDLSLRLAARLGPGGRVVGLDFSRRMLDFASRKRVPEGPAPAWIQGDALRLPFRAASFDVASVAFGIRNVDDPALGLAEMARVVRPGGRVVVLEFGQPDGMLGPPYRFYGRHVMPRVGGWLTGNREAYEYLPRTVAQFPAGDAFVGIMDKVGRFDDVRVQRLTGGIAFLYVGRVAGD